MSVVGFAFYDVIRSSVSSLPCYFRNIHVAENLGFKAFALLNRFKRPLLSSAQWNQGFNWIWSGGWLDSS